MDDDFADKPTAEEQRALDTLYDGNAAQRKPLPASARGDMHTWNVADAVFTRREPELKTHTDTTPAQRQQLRADLNAIAKIGIPDDVVAQIAEGRIDALVSAARVKSDDELNAEEFAELNRDVNGSGGFENFMRGLQKLTTTSVKTIKLTETDIENVQHHAFDYEQGGWENRLLKIFSRTLGPRLGRDEGSHRS